MSEEYRIDREWAGLERTLLESGGHDRVIEFLEFALTHLGTARIARAEAHTRERTRPDYAVLAPQDLQARVAGALAKEAGR